MILNNKEKFSNICFEGIAKGKIYEGRFKMENVIRDIMGYKFLWIGQGLLQKRGGEEKRFLIESSRDKEKRQPKWDYFLMGINPSIEERIIDDELLLDYSLGKLYEEVTTQMNCGIIIPEVVLSLREKESELQQMVVRGLIYCGKDQSCLSLD